MNTIKLVINKQIKQSYKSKINTVLTVLIFFVFINGSVFAQNSLQRKLDFEVENVSINEALLQLSKQAELDIAFSNNFFKTKERISIDVENATIESILKQILRNQKIGYKTLDNRILLFRKKLQKYTISGYIEDEKAGERLIAATVYCPQQQIGMITNEYGFYSLTLEEGEEVNLQYSYLGYQERQEKLNLSKDVEINIDLEPSLMLEEIVIELEDEKTILAEGTANQNLDLNTAFVNASPSLCGTADPIRAAQNLSGIQGGIDGFGGIQVRGGEAGQNLMLLDGVPVYIPYHLPGVYSIYNPNTINSAKVLKSHFPARYGGRLSSVVDVRTREGNKYNWAGEASLNLINASLLVEGPIKKDKSSILIAGRFSPKSFLLEPTFKRTYFQSNFGTLNTNFYDVNVKANYVFSSKDRLYVSFFKGDDLVEHEEPLFEEINFSEESESELTWGNTIAALRWNHLFNNQLFLNTTLTYSQYGFEYTNLTEFSEREEGREESDELYFLDSRSTNKDIGVKFDFDYLPNPKHTLRFGAGFSDREFVPDITYIEEDFEELEDLDDYAIEDFDGFIESETYEAIEAYLYFEDEIKLKEKLSVNAGFRVSFFADVTADFLNVEPRLSLQYQLTPQLNLYASGSRMIQYLHLIPTSALRLPNDLWIPSSDEILPQEAWQGAMGFSLMPKKRIHFSLEAYAKKMENQYIYPDDLEFLEEFEEFESAEYLLKGRGQTYGIENTLKLIGQKNGLLLSYTIAKNERQFDGQNLEKTYPHNYDQRHQIKCFAHQNLSEKLMLSVNWIYNSANPQFNITTVQSGQGLVNVDVNEQGQKNQKRSEAYHRMDLDLSYRLDLPRFKHQFKCGVYNVYNRKNIAYYEADIDDEEEIIGTNPVSALPLLPSFSYSLNF